MYHYKWKYLKFIEYEKKVYGNFIDFHLKRYKMELTKPILNKVNK